ncbi:hypothetical protein [Aeromonas veronii]|uniref:hypothetical protein n=1 Tax=Aeromonas veronii TaxID=654 RepID=UPI003D22EC18
MNIGACSRKIALYALLFSGFLLVLFLSLNYYGFCFKECRKLSEKEQISIAIDYLLKIYPPVIDVYKESNGKAVVAERNIPSNPIYYGNAAEFAYLNKDCCRVTRTARKGYAVRLEHRLLGSASTFVEVRYEVKYVDKSNIVRSVKKVNYVAISNCGNPWSGI